MTRHGHTRYLHAFSRSTKLTSIAMGARNPETLPIRAWRAQAETRGQMFSGGWSVISICRTCGLSMDVNLGDMIKLKGPNLSLWNRKAPCRKHGCRGFVVFQGRPPRVTRYQDLAAPE